MVVTRQQAKARTEKEQEQIEINMPNKDLVFQSQINTLEPFTGAATQDADRWITHSTNILQIQGFTDDNELRNLLSGFLDGEALNWFQDHRTKLMDWNEFRTALTQRFPSPPSIKSTFESFQQLSNRRQGLDESTIEYHAHVLKLCQSYNPAMSDKEQVDHLKKGLRASLLEKVLDRDPSTPAEFIGMVLRIESNQRILQAQLEHDTNYNNNNNYTSSNNNNYNNNYTGSNNNNYNTNNLVDHFRIDQSGSIPNPNHRQSYHEPQQQSQQQRWSAQQQRKQSGSRGGPICYTCGKQGHISPACNLNWQ